VPKVEAASYWFETFARERDRSGKHVAEVSPTLVADSYLKFHFVSRQRSGYLYIIGPSENGNARTMFLTATGAPSLKTNYVGHDADFSLPFGNTKFHLDKHAGTDVLNLIFSPTPLKTPAFLTGESEHELTLAEIEEWEKFREQSAQDAPELTVRGEGDERRVIVLAPESATKSGKPLIFDVRINRR
jgi:hypothetical protein